MENPFNVASLCYMLLHSEMINEPCNPNRLVGSTMTYAPIFGSPQKCKIGGTNSGKGKLDDYYADGSWGWNPA